MIISKAPSEVLFLSLHHIIFAKKRKIYLLCCGKRVIIPGARFKQKQVCNLWVAVSKGPEYFVLIICLLPLRVALLFKQLVMQTTNYFTADLAQGATAIGICCTDTLLNSTIIPHSGIFSTFFAKKRNLFLPLLRTLHIINLANDFKQKVSLASNGCWIRKVQRHFVSDMWRSTLKDAFLFNNIVK